MENEKPVAVGPGLIGDPYQVFEHFSKLITEVCNPAWRTLEEARREECRDNIAGAGLPVLVYDIKYRDSRGYINIETVIIEVEWWEILSSLSQDRNFSMKLALHYYTTLVGDFRRDLEKFVQSTEDKRWGR